MPIPIFERSVDLFSVDIPQVSAAPLVDPLSNFDSMFNSLGASQTAATNQYHISPSTATLTEQPMSSTTTASSAFHKTSADDYFESLGKKTAAGNEFESASALATVGGPSTSKLFDQLGNHKGLVDLDNIVSPPKAPPFVTGFSGSTLFNDAPRTKPSLIELGASLDPPLNSTMAPKPLAKLTWGSEVMGCFCMAILLPVSQRAITLHSNTAFCQHPTMQPGLGAGYGAPSAFPNGPMQLQQQPIATMQLQQQPMGFNQPLQPLFNHPPMMPAPMMQTQPAYLANINGNMTSSMANANPFL